MWNHQRTGGRRRGTRAPMASAPGSAHRFSVEQQARRLRFLLQELGLEHACFALYLASRIDLLPIEYCHELACTPASAPESLLPPQEVQKIVRQELGDHSDRAFANIDDSPFESTLIGQSHRARLVTGAPAVVVVLRPLYYEFQGEPGRRNFLRTELINEHCAGLLTASVFADFEAALRRKTSFALAREGMELLAHDAAQFELLRAHKVYPELCSGRLMTFDLREDQPLDRVLQHRARGGDVLARRLCQVWFHQALYGHCFPVDPLPQNVRVGEGDQISFLNCDLVGLPNSAKENLQNYFAAMLNDDPDKAAVCLLKEMAPMQAGVVDADQFYSHFRQAAYFGMLEPVLGTDSNALAQITFQHWKTAIEHGYAAKPHLLCFYRGLFSIARMARSLSAAGDPLREGMEELRITGALDQMRDVMDWQYWLKNSDKVASALVQLPRTIDEALTRASTPIPELQDRGTSVPGDRGASATNLILLLILAIEIAQLPTGQGWSGKILPLALMLAGLLVLRGSAN